MAIVIAVCLGVETHVHPRPLMIHILRVGGWTFYTLKGLLTTALPFGTSVDARVGVPNTSLTYMPKYTTCKHKTDT